MAWAINRLGEATWLMKASEDEINAREEIHAVIVNAQVQVLDYAACERIRIWIKRRPSGRYRFQELQSFKAVHSNELCFVCVLPSDTQDIVHQRGRRGPLFFFRHAERADLLTYELKNSQCGLLP